MSSTTTTFYVGPFGGGGWRVRFGGAYGRRCATRDEAVQEATDMALKHEAKGGWVEVQVLGDDDCYHPHAVRPFGWRR